MHNTTGCRVVSRRGFLSAAGGGAALGLLGRGSAAWAQGETPEQLIHRAGELAAAAENDDDWNKVREVVARLNQVEAPDQKRLEDRFHDLYERKDYVGRLGAICALQFNFPSTWGMLNIAFALTIVGNYGQARRAIAEVLQGPDHDVLVGLDECLATIAIKTYRCTFNYPADRWCGRAELPLAFPTSDSPCQKLLSMELEGAGSSVEKTDDVGNRYLGVTPVPGRDVRMVAEVQITPYSFRPILRRFDPGPLPDEMNVYLGTWSTPQYVGPLCPYEASVLMVDPSSAKVQDIVSGLRGATTLDTVTNVLNWTAVNLNKNEGRVPTGPATAEDIIANGGGGCDQVTMAMAVLLRAVGVPARGLRGKPGCVGQSGTFLQHSVVEFFLNGIGWIDLQNGETNWAPLTNFVRFFRYMWPRPLSVYLPYTDQVEAPQGVYLGGIHTYELLRESLD